ERRRLLADGRARLCRETVSLGRGAGPSLAGARQAAAHHRKPHVSAESGGARRSPGATHRRAVSRRRARARLRPGGEGCVHARSLDARRELFRRDRARSEEHTSELQSRSDLVCRLLLEKKKKNTRPATQIPKKTRSSV